MLVRIYVASSWRNPWQPAVVRLLRDDGHEVYDFREPAPGESGFSWREIDPAWQSWKPEVYRRALHDSIAQEGFRRDATALVDCAACVLVLPCGNSAHLELGYAAGQRKRTAVLFPDDFRMTPIGGHSVSSSPCAPCGDIGGCHLPGKLDRVEPELMAKLADEILIGPEELIRWARHP